MKNQHYARKQRQLNNKINQLNALVARQDSRLKEQIHQLLGKIKALLADLRSVLAPASIRTILGSLTLILGLSFSNQAEAQSFANPVTNPFGLDSVYEYSFPAFADMDNDGDLDLLVGEYYGNLNFFENTGDAHNPQFGNAHVNPMGLSATYVIAAPTVADIDGDGDIDVLVGEAYGNMRFFENTGTPNAPQFSGPTANPFGLTNVSGFALPEFVDIDGDGDYDLFVGEYYGNIKYFENTGSPTNPQFGQPQSLPFGLDSTYMVPTLAFGDFDRDGDYDLIVGEYYGSIYYFENTGSATNPQFAAPQTNPFAFIPTYDIAIPACGDLDNDGDLDLIVGEYGGALKYYENTDLNLSVDINTNSSLEIFPNPAGSFFRIDGNFSEQAQIMIIDATGRLQKNIDKWDGQQLDVSDLSAGVYLIKLIDGDQMHVNRLIIQ